MHFVKVKEKQDFVDGIDNFIKLIEEIEDDTTDQSLPWYRIMMSIKFDLRDAKRKI